MQGVDTIRTALEAAREHLSDERDGCLSTGTYPDGRLDPGEQEHIDKLESLLAQIDAALAHEKVREQIAERKSQWIPARDQLPTEDDGEVLVRMQDGTCEIAWATYWHGASNAFAGWTFRDPDETREPTHWMPLPERSDQ